MVVASAVFALAAFALASSSARAAVQLTGAQQQSQCVDQNVAPLAFLSQHEASVMRVGLSPVHVGDAVDCIHDASTAGYRIYLTLGGYSTDPQKAADWYARWVRFYQAVAPLWAISVENEPELGHDPLPAETPAQYRAVWDAVAPVVHQIAPDAILVFGEGSPWSETFIKDAWGHTRPQAAGAIGFHCYGSGLGNLPEFSAWAAQRGTPMWCSEETDWLDPSADLNRVLARSPNTQLVVYYYWVRPPDPPPYFASTPLPGPPVTSPPPVAGGAAPSVVCVVPRLTRMSQRHIRPALNRAHCALGRMYRPKHVTRRHVLRVVSQSARVGSVHANRYRVNVRMR